MSDVVIGLFIISAAFFIRDRLAGIITELRNIVIELKKRNVE